MAANQSGGNDYTHFTEGSAHLQKAEEHFNRAKALFMAFKAKYPALADLKFPPSQLGLAESLTEAIPHYQTYTFPGGGNLYQRRMMARDNRAMSPLSLPLSTTSPHFTLGSSQFTPLSGNASANYPSFEGSEFESPYGYCSPNRSVEQNRRPQTANPCASRGAALCYLEGRDQMTPPGTPPSYARTPPQQFSRSASPCSRSPPFQQRRLNLGIPESHNMTGSSRSTGGGGRSDLYASDESCGSLPVADNACNYSYQSNSTANSLPIYLTEPAPAHREETVRSGDFNFDQMAERALRGGTPSPYYANVRNSPNSSYGYSQQLGCSRPASAPPGYTPPKNADPYYGYGQRGIMEQSSPEFYESYAADPCCGQQRGIQEQSMPEFYESAQSSFSP